jgi:chemotaxis protein MotB
MEFNVKKWSSAFVVGCILMLTFNSGCVTKKKYDQLAQEKFKLQLQKNQCDSSLANLDRKFKDISNKADNLKSDTASIGAELRRMRRDFTQLDKSYNQLLTNSANEAASLSRDLKRKEEELGKLETNLNTSRLQVEALNKNLKEREKRVAELEKVLADKEQATKDLNDKVNKALLGFKGKDLTVEVKNGKVYVSLSEQLLFKSGRYDVDAKGQDAIRKLAVVLKDNPDISVAVEGHTDDVPMLPGSLLKDNWDLGALRATSITKILTAEGVTGFRLSANSRGEFSPLDPSRTTEARTKNRRTEIILTPKLDELFKILGN